MILQQYSVLVWTNSEYLETEPKQHCTLDNRLRIYLLTQHAERNWTEYNCPSCILPLVLIYCQQLWIFNFHQHKRKIIKRNSDRWKRAEGGHLFAYLILYPLNFKCQTTKKRRKRKPRSTASIWNKSFNDNIQKVTYNLSFFMVSGMSITKTPKYSSLKSN